MMPFNEQHYDTILARLERGVSLRTACAEDGFPHASTVCKRMREDPEFAEKYRRARLIAYEVMADELVDVADDGANDYRTLENGKVAFDKENVLRSRLRVDTRKWVLAKMLPKIYGDRVALEASGPDGKPLAIGILGVIQQLPQAEIQRIAALPADEAKAELLRLTSGDSA